MNDNNNNNDYLIDFNGDKRIGSILGTLSLCVWMGCQFPQVIKNYKRKSTQGISKWFLLEWFIGDLTNLIGSILANQLPTQIATGSLFMMMDVSYCCYYCCYCCCCRCYFRIIRSYFLVQGVEKYFYY